MNAQELSTELSIFCIPSKCGECVFSQHDKTHNLGYGCLALSPWKNTEEIMILYYKCAELVYEYYNIWVKKHD